MIEKVRKLLPVADVVFTMAGVVALVVSRFVSSQFLFRAGLTLAILGVIGAFLLRQILKERRHERTIQITPDDWTVEDDGGGPIDAWLTITEERHEKGHDIQVRVKQVGFKRWDLAEPEIKNGTVTIRYRSNNFPKDPRIPLRLYISGRG